MGFDVGSVGGDAATGFSVGGPYGAVIGAGLGLIGGILGNDQSASNAAQANATSESELGQSEMFQEQQTQDQYIEATAGMKEAGLNPMLAATNGIQSGPLGGVPAVQTPAYRSPVDAAVSAYQAYQGNQLQGAQTEVARTQAASNSATALETQSRTNLNNIDALSRLGLNEAEIKARIGSANFSENSATTLSNNAPSVRGELDARAALEHAETVLRGFEASGARRTSEMYERAGGGLIPYVGAVGDAVNSAGSLFRNFRSLPAPTINNFRLPSWRP